jgi:hypothetical protein
MDLVVRGLTIWWTGFGSDTGWESVRITDRVEACFRNLILLAAELEVRCTCDRLTRLGVKVSLLDLYRIQ